MKHVPCIRLEPRPSRIAGALIVVACVATVGLVALLAISSWAMAIAFGATLGIGMWEFRRCAGRGAPAVVCVGDDRRLIVTDRDGRESEGEILDDSYVGAMLTTIVWRSDGAPWWSRARTLLILPDMLSADDFRSLRILLRYGVPEMRPETNGVDAG